MKRYLAAPVMLSFTVSAATNDTPVTNTIPPWTPADTVAAGAAIVIGLIGLVAVIGGLFVLREFYKRWKKESAFPRDQASIDTDFRGQLAKTVTIGALAFVGCVAGMILFAAGLYCIIPPASVAKTTFFFDVAKFVLATLLPVVAAWVGTVLAFYFGKENFEAATKSVKDMASVLTSKDKLTNTKVKVLGKAKQDFICYALKTADMVAAENETLDSIEKAFANYERLPILLSNAAPYLVLHQSTLNDFLLAQKRANPPKDAKDLKLADLFKTGKDGQPWPRESSFVTVGPDATAAQAKTAVESLKGCADILVTEDGTGKTAVVRWITNVDLLKAAEV